MHSRRGARRFTMQIVLTAPAHQLRAVLADASAGDVT